MKIKWQLNKKELHTLMRVMGDGDDLSPGNDPAENLLTEEELPKMAEKWKREGYLVPVGRSWQLEEGLQLAISTLMDPRSCFSCNRTVDKKTERKKIYFHGQTIILLEDDESEKVELLWLPFLPLAIGAVSEMFCTGNKYSEENSESLIFHMEGCCGGKVDFQKTVRRKEDEFVSGENDSEKKIYSKQEIVHEATDWLSANHKKCLEEVLHFEYNYC